METYEISSRLDLPIFLLAGISITDIYSVNRHFIMQAPLVKICEHPGYYDVVSALSLQVTELRPDELRTTRRTYSAHGPDEVLESTQGVRCGCRLPRFVSKIVLYIRSGKT